MQHHVGNRDSLALVVAMVVNRDSRRRSAAGRLDCYRLRRRTRAASMVQAKPYRASDLVERATRGDWNRPVSHREECRRTREPRARRDREIPVVERTRIAGVTIHAGNIRRRIEAIPNRR
jgi:hypothetical protein